MNDFAIPKTKSYFGIPFSLANSITPGKRAVSSMCPSIIVNGDGDVRLVIGGSGGTKITTAVAYVRIYNSFTLQKCILWNINLRTNKTKVQLCRLRNYVPPVIL
jgi:gamma-glutamyltranspeptidase